MLMYEPDMEPTTEGGPNSITRSLQRQQHMLAQLPTSEHCILATLQNKSAGYTVWRACLVNCLMETQLRSKNPVHSVFYLVLLFLHCSYLDFFDKSNCLGCIAYQYSRCCKGLEFGYNVNG
jgi:hypothetical protein